MISRSNQLILVAALSSFAFVTLTARAQFSTIINVPPEVAPATIDSNTQVNVFDGGSLESMLLGASNGSSSNMEVNVYDGNVGVLQAYGGTTVNVSGGIVNSIYEWVPQANMNVNISGGIVAAGISARNATHIRLTGGSTSSLSASAGSTVTITGSEFKLNGIPVAGLDQTGDSLPFNLPEDSLLTGLLSDGTPLSVSTHLSQPTSSIHRFDGITNVVLTLRLSAAPPSPAAKMINLPGDPSPLGLRSGQTLNVGSGAELPSGKFVALNGSIVNVGGRLNGGVDAVASEVNVSGFVHAIRAYAGSAVRLSGSGVVNASIDVFSGSTFDMASGGLGRAQIRSGGVFNLRGGRTGDILALAGSQVNFSGGRIRETAVLACFSGATINWRGGDVNLIYVEGGATFNLFGSNFLLDGAPVGELTTAGDSLVLTTRGGAVLTGLLADGSPFDVVLDPQLVNPLSTLRLAVVPEPSSLILVAAASFALSCCGARRSKWGRIEV
jgi:hypothetical protein